MSVIRGILVAVMVVVGLAATLALWVGFIRWAAG